MSPGKKTTRFGMFIRKWFHRTNQIWKAGLAAAVSWDAAQYAGSKHPFFAPLAAILCLQVTVEDSIKKGFQRIVGIIVGVLIAAILSSVMKVHDWSIALIVCLGLGIASLFKWDNGTASQIGVRGLLLITAGAGSSVSYGLDRIIETLIGAIIAVLINMFVFPPDYKDEAANAIRAAENRLAEHIRDISVWLKHGAFSSAGRDLIATARRLQQEVERSAAAVNQAVHAAKYSPFIKRRHRELVELQERLESLQRAFSHLQEMQQLIMEWRERKGMSEAERERWSTRFHQIADWAESGDREPPSTGKGLSDEAYAWSLEAEAYQLEAIFSYRRRNR